MNLTSAQLLLQLNWADNTFTPTQHRILEVLLTVTNRPDMTTSPTKEYLSNKIGVSVKTIERHIKPLVEVEAVWKKSNKGKCLPNTYSVNITALPTTRMDRLTPSVTAHNIVEWYFSKLKALPKCESKRTAGRMVSAYRKNPMHRQMGELLAEEWLNSGFTREQIEKMAETALGSNKLFSTARRGFHTLRKHLKNLQTLASVQPYTESATHPYQKLLPMEIVI